MVEEYAPCVLAVNKWDLAREARPEIMPEEYHEYLQKVLPGLWYAPVAATSAVTGENVWGLIKVARDLAAQACRTVTTGVLNRALREACGRRRPKAVKGRLGKIYYGTQTGIKPPTFAIFCNSPDLFDAQYTRYLSARLRESLGFDEVPLCIEYRSSHNREGRGK